MPARSTRLDPATFPLPLADIERARRRFCARSATLPRTFGDAFVPASLV
jgi:hypothetical protein